LLGEEETRGDEQCDAHAELDATPRHTRDDAGAEPRANDRRGDEGDQSDGLDLDDRGEDDRLRKSGKTMAHVERAGDFLVGDHAAKSKERSGRREGPDAQSVEEVGDEADENQIGRRRRPLVSPRELLRPCDGECAGG
jgi:hypothetical protein